MITNNFPNDLKYLHDILKNKTHFSLTRFGDGERGIIEGKPTGNLEFQYDGNNNFIKDELKKSLQLNIPNYFVGIPCPCCQPADRCDYMKKLSNLPDNKLTWANMFVNSNFKYFNDEFVKTFNDYNYIVFIGRGETKNLPFRVDKSFKVGKNAHINNIDLLEEIPKMIESEDINNGLFIVSAGPFANILCARLFEQYSNNTFIDIGSVFDKHQGLGATRRYLMGNDTINKKCIW